MTTVASQASGVSKVPNVVMCDPAIPPDRLRAIKSRQQAVWASGDYAVIGATLQIVGELLNEAADVEALPYPDASFDVVVSTFGVMFTPDHERAAAELTRVCRPGGRIGLASWTPDGFVGRLLRLVASYVPPAPGVPSPLLWGTADHVRALFPDAAAIAHTPRIFTFRYRSAEHWVEVFRTFYGPVYNAFRALDADRQAALEADLLALLRSLDRGGASGLVVPGEYLETVITR